MIFISDYPQKKELDYKLSANPLVMVKAGICFHNQSMNQLSVSKGV